MSLIFVSISGVDKSLDWYEGCIGDCNCSFPSIRLSIISPIVEVRFGIEFSYET